MPISPIPVGQTHVVLSLTWLDDAAAVIDLTGAAVSARIKSATAAAAAATGTLTVVSAAAGTLTYKFAAGEVTTVGDYEIQFKAVYADSTVLVSDPLYYTIVAAV